MQPHTYKLDWIAHKLGIEFEHHDAAEDARAAAQVALQHDREVEATGLREVAESTEVRIGQLNKERYSPCGLASASRRVSDITPDSEEFDEAHPFYEATVVFTGSLKSMVRRDAMQRVVNCGGECTTAVSGNTDFLVVGDHDFSRFAEGETKSRKMRDAEQYAAEGSGIEMLAEKNFLRML